MDNVERQREQYQQVLRRMQREGFETPRRAVSVEQLARERRVAAVRSEWPVTGFWDEDMERRLAALDRETAELQAEARRYLRLNDPPPSLVQRLLGGDV